VFATATAGAFRDVPRRRRDQAAGIRSCGFPLREREVEPSGAAATLGEVPESPRETAPFQAYRGSEPPRFVNAAERECALILDWYGIPWAYEPRSFVLERDRDGRVTSAFTPDFYLPDQDLYIEVTVMKQSLVTRKNRKLRELRRLYPDVNVKLFYRRDIERLAQRYRLRIAS
jgi:hypoxanthine phosphoribosyltransferase